MASMTAPYQHAADCDLAARVARLWPHREHEANILLSQCCRIGVHRWRKLDLSELLPGKEILHCFWCSKIKIDGVIYEP